MSGAVEAAGHLCGLRPGGLQRAQDKGGAPPAPAHPAARPEEGRSRSPCPSCAVCPLPAPRLPRQAFRLGLGRCSPILPSIPSFVLFDSPYP